MPFVTLDKNGAGLPPSILDFWQRLALSTGQADPLCCAPAWNISFHQIFHPERRVYYSSSPNSLILFCEYVTPTAEIYLVPMEDSWMFGQPLLGFYASELLEESLDYFMENYDGKFPSLVISGINSHAPATLKLYTLFSKFYNFYRYRTVTQSSASLRGGLDGWLARRSANHRAKLKKAARKAADAGVYFEKYRPSGAREASAIYQRMLNVEKRSWKGLGHCGMAESPSREFYAALIDRLAASSCAYVIFARLDYEDIGFIFGGACESVYRGQQFSFVDSFRHFSIGNLLQLEKIKWLCEEGFERYDMGPITGPRMSYKAHWTEEQKEIETWVMRRAF